MPLGIKAFVDFAFKKIFGSPENSLALIGLLNAILELDAPVTEVTILNPFSYQEFETARLVVLDVKALDATGLLYNVEMQISVHPGLLQRMVFYASEMYTDQLKEGDDYTRLNAAISICLLTKDLFSASQQPHHQFQLMDEQSGRKLDRAIEIHTVELKKFGHDRSTISSASALAQWSWLILNAHQCSAEELRELFPDLSFQQAISCLEVISSKTEDKLMHDQREKAQRDYDWMLSTAKSQGMNEGREEGREEGTVIGAIQILQQILSEPISATDELLKTTDHQQQTMLAELQNRVRSRLR